MEQSDTVTDSSFCFNPNNVLVYMSGMTVRGGRAQPPPSRPSLDDGSRPVREQRPSQSNSRCCIRNC